MTKTLKSFSKQDLTNQRKEAYNEGYRTFGVIREVGIMYYQVISKNDK